MNQLGRYKLTTTIIVWTICLFIANPLACFVSPRLGLSVYALVTFGITCLCNDIIHELDPEMAKKMLWLGFAVEGVSALIFQLTRWSTTTLIITGVSLLGYTLSWVVNYTLFNIFKKININKGLYETLSTITGQLVDTIVFVSLCATFNAIPYDNIIRTITITWLAKSIVAVFDTPIFLLATRRRKQ